MFFVASSHSISSNSSLPKAYLLKTYSTHSAAPVSHKTALALAASSHRTQDNLLTTGSIYWSARPLHTLQAISWSATNRTTTTRTRRRCEEKSSLSCVCESMCVGIEQFAKIKYTRLLRLLVIVQPTYGTNALLACESVSNYGSSYKSKFVAVMSY